MSSTTSTRAVLITTRIYIWLLNKKKAAIANQKAAVKKANEERKAAVKAKKDIVTTVPTAPVAPKN